MGKFKGLMGAIASMCVASFAFADDHVSQGPMISPAVTHTCKFNDGQGMKDFKAWTKRWNEWMDKNDRSSYGAVALTPYYTSDQAFDIGWVGFSDTAEALGRGLDLWAEQNGDLAKDLNKIVSCESNAVFASLEIADDDGWEPTSPAVSFADCTLDDGVEIESAMQKLGEWGAYRKEKGLNGPTVVWFPAYGESPDASYDFKYLEVFADLEEWGKDFDMYGNDGGWQKADELFDGVMDCNSARLYNVHMIRDNSAE